MILDHFNYKIVHHSWHECLTEALQLMDQDYLLHLHLNHNWIPGIQNIFNAFSQPADQVNYLLLGESPYPRCHSANGYAFWDAAVSNLWSPSGLSTQVNRATSLRNFIKMLLISANLIAPTELSQQAISKITKTALVKTNTQLFNNILEQKFLLLNASLALSINNVKQEVKIWQPFLHHIISFVTKICPQIKFIFFGKLAQATAQQCAIHHMPQLRSEHPYNNSFITNPQVLDFFRGFNLLTIRSQQS